MERVIFSRLEFASVRATQATEWVFAEIFDDQGLKATTEITAGNSTAQVVQIIRELLANLSDLPLEPDVQDALGLTTEKLQSDRVLATAVSAIRSAISDIQAQRAKLTLMESLGGDRVDSVQLYANLNRSLLNKDRSPTAFAKMAERAIEAGFDIVKCAPFDEVNPPSTPDEILELARPGIQRVAAVRSAIGHGIRFLVDCHSRFERHTAAIIAEELAKLDVGWFEEPVSPTTNRDDLAEIASEVRITVAGGESGYGEMFFSDLIKRGSVQTVMPDIKFCGGVGEAVRVGRAASLLNGNVSLHSPSGPISLLASAHATAAIPNALPLEHAVYETDWRSELTVPNERVQDGRLWFPDAVGLGATLNEDIIERFGRRWTP